MKTAKELCEQIEQDKIDKHNYYLNQIIEEVRCNNGVILTSESDFSYAPTAKTVEKYRDDLLKLGYKIKDVSKTKFFGGVEKIYEISACCEEDEFAHMTPDQRDAIAKSKALIAENKK